MPAETLYLFRVVSRADSTAGECVCRRGRALGLIFGVVARAVPRAITRRVRRADLRLSCGATPRTARARDGHDTSPCVCEMATFLPIARWPVTRPHGARRLTFPPRFPRFPLQQTGTAKSAGFSGVKVPSKDAVRLASKRSVAMAYAHGTVKLPEGMAAPAKLGPDVFNSTYYPKGEDTDCSRKPWIVVDAADLRLGRLSTLLATYLRGGNVATYSPSMNMGTYVVVINAEQVVVSGKKFEDKLYKRHTQGRPGAMKEESFRALQARIPERIIEKAVRGMLPKNRMGRELFTQLKVYSGSEHPHAAQNPTDVTTEVKERCYSSSMKR